MFALTLYLSFFLRLLFLSTAVDNVYNPTEYFLLDCGSTSTTISLDSRNWEGDDGSKFSPANIAAISNASTASEQNSGIDRVPYMTARIIHSPFTYIFPVSAGPKFLRLYFYPATYSGLNNSQSFFDVTAGGYTLLSNFSAFLTVTAQQPKEPSLVKEFILVVKDNQRLQVTFSPSPNSYAFVNGIEVVSIPDNFYIRGNDYRIKNVGQITDYYIDSSTALEKIYRLNVGGNEVGVTDDTGMYRSWVQDDDYIYGAAFGFTPHLDNITIKYTSETPNYTAPKIVYTTSRTMGNFSLQYNLTWFFPVDSGFHYLLRLYFCEILMEVTLPNQRVFTIFINNQTAEEVADVITWSTGRGIPVYKDYVVLVPDDSQGRRSKQDLWLAMYPYLDSKPQYGDAILNGLEIFKLSSPDGNLAGPNPERVPVADPTPTSTENRNSKRKGSSPLSAIIGGVVGGIAVFAILGFLVFRRRQRVKHLGTSDGKSSWAPISYTSRSTKTSGSSLPSDLCRRFSLLELKSATDNFDEKLVIGSGGFGNVYKGYIDKGATTVAIKRLNATSKQGVREFETEIQMLSKLRHLHLVSLIGYCDDNGEMALVYDYMARGTLRDHLYKSTNPPLPWKQRLQICIGAARGLHYLHTGSKRTIIHRDVKATNILLDDKWVAKVSDFGLSKMGPSDVSHSHVSTVVKGSFGYLDPEYYRRQQLTEKSDVYSFGVVLFEVLCARPVINPALPKEQVSLAEWARICYRKGTVDKITDPHLTGQIAPECLTKFGEVAYNCLRDQGIERPAMNDVVWSLEFALQLQESAEKMVDMDKLGSPKPNPYVPLLLDRGEATTTDSGDGGVFSGSNDVFFVSKSSGSGTTTSSNSHGFNSHNVFSEIMNPTAR